MDTGHLGKGMMSDTVHTTVMTVCSFLVVIDGMVRQKVNYVVDNHVIVNHVDGDHGVKGMIA